MSIADRNRCKRILCDIGEQVGIAEYFDVAQIEQRVFALNFLAAREIIRTTNFKDAVGSGGPAAFAIEK